MSRTDKDKPWWATGEWTAHHTIACNAGRVRCPLEPRRRLKPHHWSWRVYRDWSCHWEPGDKRRPTDGPPRWYVNHRWTGPDRMAARTACDRAAAEHRAGHEPEVEAPTRNHRNCAQWEWS